MFYELLTTLGKQITDDYVPQIMEMLSPEVQVLNLSGKLFLFFSSKENKIGEKGGTEIAHMLKKNTSLTHIDLYSE